MSRHGWREIRAKWLVAPLLLICSCQMLDREVAVFDPVTGEETGTTTVGDIVAGSAETVADTAGTVIGGVTGNPIFGVAASAAVLGLFGARRRKKQAAVEAE